MVDAIVGSRLVEVDGAGEWFADMEVRRIARRRR